MGKAQKDLSKEEEATLYEMFDYLCSKIDWSKSFLDATAVCSMNRLSIELKKDKEKHRLGNY